MRNLKNQNVWVCWKYVQKNGRRTKQPFAVSGIPTGTSADHAGEWNDYETAENAVRQFDGIGFVMPESYFLLDIDHRKLDDPLTQEIRRLLPTYMEVSPSGEGYHLYGTCDLTQIPRVTENGRQKLAPQYLYKNSELGIELYIGGLTNRFATYTGDAVEDRPVADCTEGVLQILESYMRRQSAVQDASSIDADSFNVLTEDDIPEILSSLRKAKNSKKFIALYDKGEIPDGKTHSDADAALCAMIAFRAGPNPELIDTIFRQSELYRPKWDRQDYAAMTIKAGIEACHGEFHHALRKMPPFVLFDGRKEYVAPTLLAEYVRTHLHYKMIRVSPRDPYDKYVYDGGVYKPYSEDMFKGAIKKFIEAYNPNLVTMGVLTETASLLKTDLEYVPEDMLNADENIINFQNGILQLDTMELTPHNPAVISTIQIPCDWKGTAMPTPVFDAYIDTLADAREDVKRLLLEFMGACLSNISGFRMKKSLFLYGEGNTGKSQLKRLTEKLLGFGNYTGIDLTQLEARFGTADIYGKRLAGSSDMSFIRVAELKVFKKATGGDVLFAEYKGKNPFPFVYRGLLWFCANELPRFGGDDGEWIYSRILPIHCPNVIPVSKQDAKLLDKMYEERVGIVYKAVMAFKAVIDNGYRFAEPEHTEDVRTQYRVDNNSALTFFEECMVRRKRPPKRDDPFTVTEIYREYTQWYSTNYGDSYRKSKKEFFADISAFLGDRDMQVRVSKGMVLKDYILTKEATEQYGTCNLPTLFRYEDYAGFDLAG